MRRRTMSTTSPALADLLSRMRELGLDDSVGPELAALTDEVQATTSQLEAANKELVTATSDLEATGDELARAATELSAINDELEQRSSDVERVTAYLQSVIDGVPGAVVVVDVDQKVRAWSAGAAARWGSPRSDVSGKAFGRLDLKGETPDLIGCVRSILADEAVAGEPTTVGEDGAEARCHPLRGADGGLEGAVLFVTG